MYYTDCSNNFQMEVEVKVARAIFGFYDNTDADRDIASFAKQNANIITKILNGDKLSKKEWSQWMAGIKDIEENTIELYYKNGNFNNKEEKKENYYRRFNFLRALIDNSVQTRKNVNVYKN